MRIVFMGTPTFASQILRRLMDWPEGEIVGVYTQPDRPAGRGNKLKESAVKHVAQEHGLPVFQPANFKDEADVEALRALRPDVLVVAAYGLLLPQKVLDIPILGAYNVHASLLPKYRGAAPVQRALMNGDAITGVTIMRMEAGLDTGPMLLQQAVSIEPDDDAGFLLETLAEHGGTLMIGALGMIAEGRAAFTPQNDALATYAPKLTAADERVDWTLPAQAVHSRIRGLSPEPGARAVLHIPGKDAISLRIENGEPLGSALEDSLAAGLDGASAAPGTVVGFDGKALLVACGSGIYRILLLRPAGKDTMSAKDFYNGRLRQLEAPYGRLADE